MKASWKLFFPPLIPAFIIVKWSMISIKHKLMDVERGEKAKLWKMKNKYFTSKSQINFKFNSLFIHFICYYKLRFIGILEPQQQLPSCISLLFASDFLVCDEIFFFSPGESFQQFSSAAVEAWSEKLSKSLANKRKSFDPKLESCGTLL